MAKTQYYTATTLDGFIADEANSLEWLFAVESDGDDHQDRFAQFFDQVGAFAMGSTTYQWILEHEKLLDEPAKWQQYYGTTPVWVFTHRDLPTIPGAVLTFVRDDVRPVHEQMMAVAGGKNIWLAGGGELVGQFADHGLLDEIIVSIAPALLGAGAPLLPRRLGSARLRLTSVEHDDAFVHLTYAVTGP